MIISLIIFQSVTLDAVCTNYEVLDDARRQYSHIEIVNYLDDDLSEVANNWKGRNFYRIMDPAGTKIKEGCVTDENACGSKGQGYITAGTHPALHNQREKLTVCFKDGAVCPPSSCYREVEIEAINCGTYYVYDLLDIECAGCFYAYCAA